MSRDRGYEAASNTLCVSPLISGSMVAVTRKARIRPVMPMRVIKFGASHVGSLLVMPAAHEAALKAASIL